MATAVKVRHGLGVLLALAPFALWAQIPEAYQRAARQAGIPATVLYAVALQESGVVIRKRRLPWPWTLNIGGKGHYYPTRIEACRALMLALRSRSARRIDVGLMQLNLGYQQRYYRQPCALLSPTGNLAVAASILRQNKRSGETWLSAIGRYHRPAGGEPAARYRRNVAVHLDQLTEGKATP